MSGKLKLGVLADEKPVRLTVELPAETHRLLQDYAAALKQQTGQEVETAKLIGPMLLRFMTSDRAFSRGRSRR
jgi:hypothetical protein